MKKRFLKINFMKFIMKIGEYDDRKQVRKRIILGRIKMKKMSVLGIGPVYVISCLIITILSIYISEKGFLNSGKVYELKGFMLLIGAVCITLGIVLWIKAVISQKMVKAIKNNKLLTTGVYSIVRNPVYSAFYFVLTGLLLIEANLWLLMLPILFWIYMTVLLKLTEEKWLLDTFGEEYIKYCSKVNRVFPWFPKK